MTFLKSKRLKWLSIPIAVVLGSTLLVLYLPAGVSVSAGGDSISLSMQVVYATAGGIPPTPTQALPQAPTIGEVVAKRTQNSKTYYLGNGQYSLDTTIGSAHYKDTQGSWQEIDNAWLPAVAPWNWYMTKDGYQTYVLNDFTAGQVLKFQSQGSAVAFQPMELQWTNNLNQIQSISMPQNVPVSVTNEAVALLPGMTGSLGIIRWDNAYGIGRDFEWKNTPGRLSKLLQLDAAPPAPAQYIIDGGNPVLALNFIFAPSKDLEIWVDGALWNQRDKIQTVNFIEFKKNGEVLWSFNPARYWDSARNGGIGTTVLSKSGNSLYVSALVPYNWLQTATYPVYIDPSLDYQVKTTTANDGRIAGSSFSNTSVLVGNYYSGVENIFARWTAVTIPVGSTIGSNTYISYRSYGYSGTLSSVKTRLFFNLSGDAVAPTTYATYIAKAVTVAYTNYNPSAWVNGTWYNVDAHSQVAELVAAYDFSAGKAMMALHKDNGSSESDVLGYDYSTDTASAAKLHIEYTAGASVPTVVTGSASSITGKAASCAENVTATGGANVTSWGTQYGTTTSYGSNVTSTGSQASAFGWSDALSGLSANTTYYYRGFGINSAGNGYGSSANFTTLTVVITNTPSSIAFGTVLDSTTVWSYTANATGPPNPITDAYCKFAVTNNGTAAINITVSSTNFTGGIQVTLGTPASMVARMTAFKSGDNITSGGVVLTNGAQAFISGLAASAHTHWEIKLESPTAYTDSNNKSATITLTASAA